MLRVLMILFIAIGQTAFAKKAVSPNGLLSLTPSGEGYVIQHDGSTVLDIHSVGYEGWNAEI